MRQWNNICHDTGQVQQSSPSVLECCPVRCLMMPQPVRQCLIFDTRKYSWNILEWQSHLWSHRASCFKCWIFSLRRFFFFVLKQQVEPDEVKFQNENSSAKFCVVFTVNDGSFWILSRKHAHTKKRSAPRERGNNQEVSALPWKEKQHLWSCFLSENSLDGPLLQLTHGAHQLAHFLDRLLQRCCSHDLRQTHMTGHKTCSVTAWGAHKVWLGFFHLKTETLQKLTTASYHLTCCTHCVSKTNNTS